MSAALRWRPYRPADLPALVEMLGPPASGLVEDLAQSTSLPQGRLWIFEIDGQVVGALETWWVLDEVEIIDVHVHRDHRRRGHGRVMIDALIAACRAEAVARIHLEVRAGNVPARALYTHTGFEIVGQRRGYYPPASGVGEREDAVLMCLGLG